METVQELLTKTPVGETTVLDMVKDLDGKPGLVITHRREPPLVPTRRESPRREHTFFDVEGFGSYLNVYGCANSVMFADPEAARISAVLDETAETQFEVVSFAAQIHPLWAPWAALLNGPTDLGSFLDVVANNRRAVVEPDGRELVLMLSQVKASEHIEVQKGRGRDALNGIMVQSKVQGVVKDELVEIPESLTIRAPLYLGRPARDVVVDLYLSAADGGVHVRLSAGDLRTAMVEEFSAMAAAVRKECPGTFTFGKPAFGGWAYIGPHVSHVG